MLKMVGTPWDIPNAVNISSFQNCVLLDYKKHFKNFLKGKKNVKVSVGFNLRTCRSAAVALSINLKHEDSEIKWLY